MANSPKNNFIPFFSFNHPIFAEIEEKIKELLSSGVETVDRQLQVKSLIYVTFNTYVSLLLSNLPEKESLDFITELEDVNDQAELMDKICSKINYSKEELINKYLQLFGHKNQ
ncbi:MAG: hypothetical protein WCK37_04490 [Candidatus Falkowbacteria bacterium]